MSLRDGKCRYAFTTPGGKCLSWKKKPLISVSRIQRPRGQLTIVARIHMVIKRAGLLALPLKSIVSLVQDSTLAYLKATNLPVGLIINFTEATLRVRRVVRSAVFATETPKVGNADRFV